MIQRPQDQDPFAWAQYNAAFQGQAGQALRDAAAIASPPTASFDQVAALLDDAEALTLEGYAIEVRELPPCIQMLTLAVRRAAAELQDGGERENRIALQLLTALALFAAETET